MDINDREAWIMELGDYIIADILGHICEPMGLPTPPVKYSVSYAPNTRAGSKRMGCCSIRAVSGGGYNEIFISPELDGSQSLEIMATVVHELIHAYLDCEDGHKGRFKKIAIKAGLDGPMPSTTASAPLLAILEGYLDVLGPIPHDAMNYKLRKAPKASGVNHTIECSDNACDFKFRTSQKQIDAMTSTTCLACQKDTLYVVGKEV